MAQETFEGGCLCGQVRWRATAPAANIRVCHCRLCQRATGAPFFARAVFRAEDFSWSGEVTAWPTSPRIDRRACVRCGTPMFATPKDSPARIGVSIATCDDRNALVPDCHIWVSEKAAWVAIADGLPQFDHGFVERSA